MRLKLLYLERGKVGSMADCLCGDGTQYDCDDCVMSDDEMMG